MRIERLEASKHKAGRVLIFLEDGTLVEAERKKPQAPASRRRFRR